jgi:transketolase
LLRPSETREPDATLVLQGSEVAYSFVTETLPLLIEKELDVAVYYVASAELFDLLSEVEQESIFSETAGQEAMGITGFTLPTMYRWVRSSLGRKHTLYPFRKGHFLGSGKAESVIAEAGLDGLSQFYSIQAFIEERRNLRARTTRVPAIFF